MPSHVFVPLRTKQRSQSVLLFTFYLVIIEFNDLANEKTVILIIIARKNRGNQISREKTEEKTKRKSCSIILSRIT